MSANSSSGGSLTMSSADSPQPGSGSHILNIRNARMRAESDVTLLRNRLEKLGQEERKALKKIEETRKRAEQIIQLRARNERAHLRKQLEAERSERQRDRRREALQASKNEMSGKVQANVDALQAQKKHDAAGMRDQRALINDYLRVKQQQQLERNRQVTEVPAPRLPPPPVNASPQSLHKDLECRRQVMREHAADVQRRRMQERMEYEESLQLESEERLMVEEQRRRLADKTVSLHREEEQSAIERLQQIKQYELEACKDLELAVGGDGRGGASLLAESPRYLPRAVPPQSRAAAGDRPAC